MEPIGGQARIPRISVVLCTYNGGRFLKEQLESVALQSRLPAEVVVCDDGSVDETLDLLRQFRSRASFPVHITKNPQRLGTTKNFEQAINLASGEFIALCDQDDLWAPGKLERLSQVMETSPFVGAVFSDANLIDGNSKPIGKCLFAKHKFSSVKQRRFLSDPPTTLLKHDVVTGATLMFRASMRRFCLPIPGSWVHDGWLTWKISLHSRLGLVAEPLISYRVHSGQQLGVGPLNGVSSTNADTETRRRHYARVARQFEDLLRDLLSEGWNPQEPLVTKIREKIKFLMRQSMLSQSLAVRTLQVTGQLHSYLHYARGIASLRTDLLLRREMP
jgi:glycosyltransferase involved in cell wall biosynthesis